MAKAAGGAHDRPRRRRWPGGGEHAADAIVKRFKPRAILISGCQDNQTSMDGEHNGAFTEQLLKVWNHGDFDGNYATFHAHIKARHAAHQSPNLFTMGPVVSLPEAEAVHRLTAASQESPNA